MPTGKNNYADMAKNHKTLSLKRDNKIEQNFKEFFYSSKKRVHYRLLFSIVTVHESELPNYNGSEWHHIIHKTRCIKNHMGKRIGRLRSNFVNNNKENEDLFIRMT